MNVKRLLIAVFAFIASPLVSASAGLEVAPLFIDMPAQSGATATMRVTNSGPRATAVEIALERRSFSDLGEEPARAPAEEAFLVFPPQALVGPGTSQIFRIQLLDPGDVDRTVAYQAVAQQLPLNLTDRPATSSDVTLLVSVAANLYVSPPNAESDVSITDLVWEDGDFRLTVRNAGRRYARLSQGVLRLSCIQETGDPRWTKTWSGDRLSVLLNGSYVPPIANRIFSFTIEEDLACASFDIAYRRS